MPISVACRCGKRFAANESLAGKRVKCPACSEPISIPNAAAPAVAATEPPIPVACSCGRRFNAPARLMGKQVACPGCGSALHIGAADDADPLGDLTQFDAASYSSPPATQYAYGAAANPSRPASAAKSQLPFALLATVGGIAAALLLIAVIVVAAMVKARFAPRPPRPTNFKPEVVEKVWKNQNPDPVTWQREDYEGVGFSIERPTGKALSLPRHSFNTSQISDARCLGPDGPYFNVKRMPGPIIIGTPPASEIEQVERKALDVAVTNRFLFPQGATIAKTTDFDIDGHPGREFMFTDTVQKEPVVVYLRLLVAGRNVYALIAGGLKSNTQDEDVRRFFDSFKLLGGGTLGGPVPVVSGSTQQSEDYAAARKTFKTKLTRHGPAPQAGDAIQPLPKTRIVPYRSGDLELQAIVSEALPGVPKRPGVLFLHGGFAFGDGDWEMVQPFLNTGYHVMIPVLRGENGQPGDFSLYYDEVDDVLAAAEVFAALPYVDEDRLFIAGHSAGGTLTALACLASDRFRAGACFSGLMEVRDMVESQPVFQVFDKNDPRELQMRSPLAFATSFKCPMRLFYGSQERAFLQQTNETAKRAKAEQLNVQAMQVAGDHFTSVDPAIKQTLGFFAQYRQ